jgi:hypothetical protein
MATAFFPTGTTAERLGFDELERWVMVPEGGTKTVLLKDAANLSLKVADSKNGVLSFSEQSTQNGRKIVLTGSRPGTVRLQAQDSAGRVQAGLEITVKARRQLSTFIHFVFDNRHWSTNLGLDNALQTIDVVNKLLLPQANVALYRRDSGAVYLPFKLDRGLPLSGIDFTPPPGWFQTIPGPLPCFSSAPVGPLGCIPESSRGNLSQQDFDGIREWNMTAAIVSHVDPKSDYNVFFVPRFDEPPGSLTGAITPRDWQRNTINVAIVSDAVQGQGLAHELLHFLLNKAKFMDKSGHSNGPNDLMKVNPGQNDILVPKQQANFINPSGWP